jgi:hypothetical protein
MRIYIWQQFASNHSGGFTVIGEFETVEAAQMAGKKLREMLELIAQFRHNYYEQEPTGPEVEFGKEYGIEWNYTLDWLSPEVPIEKYLTIVENRIIITNGFMENTYHRSHPVDQLMARIAPCVFVHDGEGRRFITFNLTCTAPDEQTANAIFHKTALLFKLQYYALGENPYPKESRSELQEAASNWPEIPYDLDWEAIVSAYVTSEHEQGITRDELKLQFHDVTLLGVEDLLILIEWLENKGFTEIHYTFNQRQYA